MLVQPSEAGIRISLQDASEVAEETRWMLAAPIGRVEVDPPSANRGREGAIVPHHRPQPADPSLAASKYRHRRVIGMLKERQSGLSAQELRRKQWDQRCVQMARPECVGCAEAEGT